LRVFYNTLPAQKNIDMKRSTSFAVWLVSGLLVVYNILLVTGWSKIVAGILFFISPFLVAWMAYRIIRYDTYTGKDLKEDEEWGYCDKKKEELNIF
jgi:hypothetical protein